jgi:hypothetical protein
MSSYWPANDCHATDARFVCDAEAKLVALRRLVVPMVFFHKGVRLFESERDYLHQ